MPGLVALKTTWSPGIYLTIGDYSVKLFMGKLSLLLDVCTLDNLFVKALVAVVVLALL